MINLAEILRLAIALAILPLALTLAKGVRDVAGRTFYLIAVTGIYLGMTLTILENLPGSAELLNTLQHVSYGVAGIFGALGAYQSHRDAVRINGGA